MLSYKHCNLRTDCICAEKFVTKNVVRLHFLSSRYSDSLRAGRSGDRTPVGARFSAPDQTGPGAYQVSSTMGTGSFQGVKRPGRGVDHPPPSSAEVKERVELYLYSPSGSSWTLLGWTLPCLPSTRPASLDFSVILYQYSPVRILPYLEEYILWCNISCGVIYLVV
jgi:hypothetical protein